MRPRNPRRLALVAAATAASAIAGLAAADVGAAAVEPLAALGSDDSAMMEAPPAAASSCSARSGRATPEEDDAVFIQSTQPEALPGGACRTRPGASGACRRSDYGDDDSFLQSRSAHGALPLEDGEAAQPQDEHPEQPQPKAPSKRVTRPRKKKQQAEDEQMLQQEEQQQPKQQEPQHHEQQQQQPQQQIAAQASRPQPQESHQLAKPKAEPQSPPPRQQQDPLQSQPLTAQASQPQPKAKPHPQPPKKQQEPLQAHPVPVQASQPQLQEPHGPAISHPQPKAQPQSPPPKQQEPLEAQAPPEQQSSQQHLLQPEPHAQVQQLVPSASASKAPVVQQQQEQVSAEPQKDEDERRAAALHAPAEEREAPPQQLSEEQWQRGFDALPAEVSAISSAWLLLQAAWQLVQGIGTVATVKLLCTLGNAVVYTLPLPQVLSWQRVADSGDADAAPYISIAFGACQWSFYGVFAWTVTGQRDFLVLMEANVLGAVLGLYYTVVFFRTCHDEEIFAKAKKTLVLYLALALFDATTVLTSTDQASAVMTVGLVGSVCSFLSAGSMLAAWQAVVTSAIPGYVVLINMCSAFTWVLYGTMMGDWAVASPNFANLVACLVCLWMKMRGQDKPLNDLIEPRVFKAAPPQDASRLLREKLAQYSPPGAICAGTGETPSFACAGGGTAPSEGEAGERTAAGGHGQTLLVGGAFARASRQVLAGIAGGGA